MLTVQDLNAIKQLRDYKPQWKVAVVDITFPRADGPGGYVHALDRACEEIATLIDHDYKIAVLSDRQLDAERVSLSMLVALGGVHHYLVRNRKRSKIALVVETGEAREVHQICVLLGYGADAVNPYLAIEAILKMKRDRVLTDGQMQASKMI